jgi:hypothetical protein
MKKKEIGNILVSVGVIIFVIVIIFLSSSDSNATKTDEDLAKCIGENSVLYVQLGCPHCETQEEIFGSYLEHLNIIDCFYEKEKCEGIQGTPTWKINGELYVGVQPIDKLKELTGC